jgi:Flp pilus assembly protein TadG
MAALIVVALAVAYALVPLAGAAVDRARASSAADAAALAGAAEGEDAARDVAAANGAVLVSYVADGSSVSVTVSNGAARASARARRDDSWPG